MSKVSSEIKLDFSDVLIVPRRSTVKSRSEVKLTRSLCQFLHARGPNTRLDDVIPIMASNMDSVVNFEVCRILAKNKMMAAVPKHYRPNDWIDEFGGVADKEEILKHLAITAGTSSEDLDKVKQICGGELGQHLRMVCLDVANGYSTEFSDTVRRVREELPDKIIMAGNVVTAEMVEDLLLNGADIVKIGIGPGSVCLTRYKTGIGYPQLSAILECEEAAHRFKGLICSDGGCTCPGDVAKAFGAGADFVMLGGMFAGHLECPGAVIKDERTGKEYKEFYGMASRTAQEKHHGGLAEYRASEGKTVRVPCRGSINDTIQDLLGGLRSACTYTGSFELADMGKHVNFIRVKNQLNTVFGGPNGGN